MHMKLMLLFFCLFAYFSGSSLAMVFDCEFGLQPVSYDESCTNGATGIASCRPGQLKIGNCIGQDGNTSPESMCDPCPAKYFQRMYNRCFTCHPCSDCGVNERIKAVCTSTTDTSCEKIPGIPDPDPTSAPTPTQTQKPPPPPTTTSTLAPTPATSWTQISPDPGPTTYVKLETATYRKPAFPVDLQGSKEDQKDNNIIFGLAIALSVVVSAAFVTFIAGMYKKFGAGICPNPRGGPATTNANIRHGLEEKSQLLGPKAPIIGQARTDEPNEAHVAENESERDGIDENASRVKCQETEF